MHAELHLQPDTECIICLDDVETEWITLECQHQYHKKCIQTWMHIRTNCPVCIREITHEHALRIGVEEHIINIAAIPSIEDNQVLEENDQQRRFALFLCIMILIAIGSMIFGLYELMEYRC